MSCPPHPCSNAAMNMSYVPAKPVVALLVGAFSLALNARAAEPEDSREKPLVLLESVKKRDLDSQLAVKETELKRLNEDLEKRQKEQESLQKSMDSIAIAVAESNDLLEQYLARKKYLIRALELTTQRIEAERLKVDGLKTLTDAQAKQRDYIGKQYEATSIRANIEGANFRILSQKQTPPEGEPAPKDAAAKLLSEIADLKKRLERSERAVATASKLARDSMNSASEKVIQAEGAAAKAKRTAQEWGLNENAEPVAEKVDAEPSNPAAAETTEKKN